MISDEWNTKRWPFVPRFAPEDMHRVHYGSHKHAYKCMAKDRIVPGQQPCNRRSFHIHDSIAFVSDTRTYDVAAGSAVGGANRSMAALRNRLNS